MVNYKAFYEGYHRGRRLPKRLINPKNFTYRHIIDTLDRYCPAASVLDFGSGVGSISLYLANQGKQVVGIELSQKAVAVAKKSAVKFNLANRVKFLRRDLFQSRLTQKFDLAICSEVLEHLPDDGLALIKLRRQLKPRGRLLISVPSLKAPLARIGLVKAFDQRSGHLHRYTPESLQGLLRRHGFQPIYLKENEGLLRDTLFVFPGIGNQIIRLANRFGIISDLLTLADNLTLKLFGGSQLIIVAKAGGKPRRSSAKSAFSTNH